MPRSRAPSSRCRSNSTNSKAASPEVAFRFHLDACTYDGAAMPRATVSHKPAMNAPSQERPPYLGFGLGLRAQHYADILDGDPQIDWFEAISENYMVPGGQPLRMLDRIRARYPIVMHGVSLSIASTAPFDPDYLRAEGARRPRRAEIRLRSSVLDRRARREPARPAAGPLYARSAGSRRGARAARAGLSCSGRSRSRMSRPTCSSPIRKCPSGSSSPS